MLRQRLSDDMKTALKAGEKDRLGVIRLMIAGMKSADIEPGRKEPLGDAEIMALLGRMVKQRRDSIEHYVKGNRPELAAREEAEIAVIESYLPKQMDETAARAVIEKLVAETGAKGPKDMGSVMAALRARYAGQLDMGAASALVKRLLVG